MPDGLTAERARELLSYDPDSGIFLWRVSPSKPVRSGSVAGYCTTNGYRRIRVDKRPYRAHRIAWLIVNGAWPPDQIDHINGRRDDNRICNLRLATHQDNNRNQRKPDSNTSGVVGVYWNKRRQKWNAYIKVDRKLLDLGCFTNISDATQARMVAERKYEFDPLHGAPAEQRAARELMP